MANLGLQNAKFLNVTPPAAIVDDAAYTTAEVDTLGYEAMTYVVSLGATDIAMVALKATESDTSGSGHADISGADFDGDTDDDGSAAALPSATDDDNILIVNLDLRKRKRYVDLSATAGDGTAGTYLHVLAILHNPDETPATQALRGVEHSLTV